MTPLVFGLSALIVLILILLVSMVFDLFKTGFFVWHRNSVGHLLQYLVWTACLLYSVVGVRKFIGELEENGYQVSRLGPDNVRVECKF